ncbi:hypothetical protein SCOCK_290016 [Actinacidiphila cocklensis]|uniref:Uncharacterized protein n=1 Tax=Actinacidiphila cocklensis TaxID=887465 RepID=A0A9W4DR23_9ACTN|nr:hypothetical protein SCOCK_290016 [Actinacidiphila cocklensis]
MVQRQHLAALTSLLTGGDRTDVTQLLPLPDAVPPGARPVASR